MHKRSESFCAMPCSIQSGGENCMLAWLLNKISILDISIKTPAYVEEDSGKFVFNCVSTDGNKRAYGFGKTKTKSQGWRRGGRMGSRQSYEGLNRSLQSKASIFSFEQWKKPRTDVCRKIKSTIAPPPCIFERPSPKSSCQLSIITQHYNGVVEWISAKNCTLSSLLNVFLPQSPTIYGKTWQLHCWS